MIITYPVLKKNPPFPLLKAFVYTAFLRAIISLGLLTQVQFKINYIFTALYNQHIIVINLFIWFTFYFISSPFITLYTRTHLYPSVLHLYYSITIFTYISFALYSHFHYLHFNLFYFISILIVILYFILYYFLIIINLLLNHAFTLTIIQGF